MSSLENIVSGMSKETNTSTLGWDVVVNYRFAFYWTTGFLSLTEVRYSAKELNEVLKAAYDDSDRNDQLKQMHV